MFEADGIRDDLFPKKLLLRKKNTPPRKVIGKLGALYDNCGLIIGIRILFCSLALAVQWFGRYTSKQHIEYTLKSTLHFI